MTHHEYQRRASLVYGDKSVPACRAKGPNKAECLLEPGHGGEYHEGNGFDAYGPMYKAWRVKAPR